VAVSDQTYHLMGLERGQFNNTLDSFLEHVHLDDRDQLVPRPQRLFLDALSPSPVEFRVVQPDGGVRWLVSLGTAGYASVDKSRPNRPMRFRGTVHDITDRKKAEEELRRTRDLLTSLLDHAPLPISVIDKEGHLRLVNRGWEQFVGRPRQEVVG